MIPWLQPGSPFPTVDTALTDPNGLLVAGEELSPERIIEAYRLGIFPWFSPGEPVLWWSPDPRMVLEPSEFKLSRSLGRRIRKADYEIRVDTCFRRVMEYCGEPRPGQRGTWIGQAMIEVYARLHELGHAHSIETWIDGELAGGLYGLAIGKMFYGESMFSRRADASKLALAHLCRQLDKWHFGLIDCQMETPHLASLGARTMTRATFSQLVKRLVELEHIPGPWRFD